MHVYFDFHLQYDMTTQTQTKVNSSDDVPS